MHLSFKGVSMDNNTRQQQEQIIKQLGGRAIAERLAAMRSQSYPSGTAYDRLMGTAKTADQMFVAMAKHCGFNDKQINLFKRLD
jgi:hypothetical protein